MTYRVELDIYNGPLDLLLYLIRKEEVEIVDIPILRITEQYMSYLGLLEGMDINVAGDFLVMAATLMEIKSRMILPRPEMIADDGTMEEEEDPRLELIRQLLEYKRFKEAAGDLESLGDLQLKRFSRPPTDVPVSEEEQRYALDELFKEVELWDLLNAFARVMRSINLTPREVVYDDTPIEKVAEKVLEIMNLRRTVLFSDLFKQLFTGQGEIGRSHVIGAFLAILECIRQRFLAVEQDLEFGDLRLVRREESESQTPVDKEDKYAPPQAFITSREEARQTDGFERPRGRFKEDELSDENVQATEFDQALDAIEVPDVEVFKPLYTDDEVLGRQPAAEPAAPESPSQTEPDDTPQGEADNGRQP